MFNKTPSDSEAHWSLETPAFPSSPFLLGFFHLIYLNFLSTTVLVSNWLTHAHFPIAPPHFPLGLLEEGDGGVQGLQEGLVVARICIRQLPVNCTAPWLRFPTLIRYPCKQPTTCRERRQGSQIVWKPT